MNENMNQVQELIMIWWRGVNNQKKAVEKVPDPEAKWSEKKTSVIKKLCEKHIVIVRSAFSPRFFVYKYKQLQCK